MKSWMRFTLALLVASTPCIAQTVPFPSKAEWTATPGIIRQAQGKYPSSVNIVLYENDCRDGAGELQNQLKKDSAYQIVATGAGITTSTPTIGDCTLTAVLTIDASAQPGNQFLVVNEKLNGGATFSSKGAAVLAMMDTTAGPTPSTPQVDVIWDVISDHVCSDSFGNHVPKYLYCIEVKIGNDSGHALQLAGIGFKTKHPFASKFGIPETATMTSANTAYQTTRSLAQSGADTTFRNLAYRSIQGIGLIMASFTPFFRNSGPKAKWSTASAIVSGAFVQAFALIAPDQTIRELTNLDDQAFRDGKLIPNNTQVRMTVFVDKALISGTLKERCTTLLTVPGKASAEPTLPTDSEVKNCSKSGDPAIVKVLLGDLVIVGDQVDYLQRMVVDTSVTSQEVNPAPTVQDTNADSKTITLTGTGLTGITAITVDGTKVEPQNQSATKIQVAPPAVKSSPATYSVTITSSSGSQTVQVKAP
ncbi:MAG: IPT/TIG domain-containing protein [Terriglobales bacterium]